MLPGRAHRPTNWSESFSTPTSAGALDPATLPNGRTVAVVLSNDADSLHWASGVPAAYLPFATSSLTGEAVDIAVLYEQLPCALDRYDGLVVISSTSLFGEGAVAELARLVDDGRLVRLPSRLGVAYAASATCAG